VESKKIKAILIDLIHPRMNKDQAMERMEELESLVNTYGGIVIIKTYQKRFRPHPKTFIGTGKVEDLANEGLASKAKLLIVNDALKPRQSYAISETLRKSKMEVWDRIDLILKIFAKHAQTTEAKLEIELASIRHMGPRIFGMGMELSRQGGGIGTVGIGEKNTEIMKRHLANKERQIKKKLEKYGRVRAGHRKCRRRNNLKTVALVGYTNAGKTTLLNRLTGRKEYVADELFATLDTRVGSLFLPKTKQSILVSDTIGFIKDLPPELLNAFASTLSEAVDADMLVHVLDASDKDAIKHLKIVQDIFDRLGIADKPRILVCNKTEGLSQSQINKLALHLPKEHEIVWISALKGIGIIELVTAIEQNTSR
jgi:GTPase